MCCLLLFGARDSTWPTFASRIFLSETCSGLIMKASGNEVPVQERSAEPIFEILAKRDRLDAPSSLVFAAISITIRTHMKQRANTSTISLQ